MQLYPKHFVFDVHTLMTHPLRMVFGVYRLGVNAFTTGNPLGDEFT